MPSHIFIQPKQIMILKIFSDFQNAIMQLLKLEKLLQWPTSKRVSHSTSRFIKLTTHIYQCYFHNSDFRGEIFVKWNGWPILGGRVGLPATAAWFAQHILQQTVLIDMGNLFASGKQQFQLFFLLLTCLLLLAPALVCSLLLLMLPLPLVCCLLLLTLLLPLVDSSSPPGLVFTLNKFYCWIYIVKQLHRELTFTK